MGTFLRALWAQVEADTEGWSFEWKAFYVLVVVALNAVVFAACFQLATWALN